MPPSPRPRTLLALLLVQREWTVEQFRSAYADTATSLYGKAHEVSDRTAKRWVAGAIAHPHPVSRSPRGPAPLTSASIRLRLQARSVRCGPFASASALPTITQTISLRVANLATRPLARLG